MQYFKRGFMILFVFFITIGTALRFDAAIIGGFEYTIDEKGTYLQDNDNNAAGANVLNYNYANTNNPNLDDEGFVNYSDIAYLKKSAIQSQTTDGLFEVNLDIKGNSKGTPMDLTFIFDYSTTMNGQKLENAISGMEIFLDELTTSLESGDIRIGVVAYNRETTTLPYTTDKETIINFLRTTQSHSGTFVQKGLYAAEQLYLNYGDSQHRNLAIHIGDGSANRAFLPAIGAPTYTNNGEITPYNGYSASTYYKNFQVTSSQYYTNSQSTVDGDPANATLATSEEISNLTLGQVVNLKEQGVEFYSIAVKPSSRGEYINKNIATDLEHYHTIDEDLLGLGTTLSNIANSINTIQVGHVIDPMGEQVILEKTDGNFVNYSLKGYIKTNGVWVENSLITNGTTVSEANDIIQIDNINLGYNEKITLTYNIHLNTEQDFQPNYWYLANERTYLIPNSSNTEYDFPIPSVKGDGIILSATKIWEDFDNKYNNRPDSIDFYIKRNNTTNPSAWVNSTPLSLTESNNWSKTFDKVTPENTTTEVYLPLYNNIGEPLDYTIIENNTSIHYLSESQTEDNTLTLKNTLKTTNMLLTKIDDDNVVMPEITFELQGVNNQYLATQTTNANGQIAFDNLVQGEYVLSEKTKLTGYKPFTDITITIDYDNNGNLIIISPTDWNFTLVNQKIDDPDEETSNNNDTHDDKLVETGFNSINNIIAILLLISSGTILFLIYKRKNNLEK